MEGKDILGETTAKLMDDLDIAYEGTDAQIKEVMVIVLVRTPEPRGDEEPTEEGDGYGYCHFRASDPVWSHQLGLVAAVQRMF